EPEGVRAVLCPVQLPGIAMQQHAGGHIEVWKPSSDDSPGHAERRDDAKPPGERDTDDAVSDGSCHVAPISLCRFDFCGGPSATVWPSPYLRLMGQALLSVTQ